MLVITTHFSSFFLSIQNFHKLIKQNIKLNNSRHVILVAFVGNKKDCLINSSRLPEQKTIIFNKEISFLGSMKYSQGF